MTTNDIINKQLEEIAALEKRLRDTEESLIAATDQVTELKEGKELRQRAEAAEQRVKELERLIRYSEEQALLPQISFEGARELINDIQKDATDAGGCYEVSTNLLDQLFERYTDRGACVLLNKFAIEQRKDEIERCKQFFVGINLDWKELSAQFDSRLEQLRARLGGK